ncbi:prolyl-tRNA synthetase [Ophiobolus disseminans]|uniref:proline--tRNA ligase n=1 Tax=Ophiobolus disseminans TaxID=1469910 RepID=A0A6A7AIU1_9PLEO|nr:prolyl-tRNA synthetase [Ophiobolus disseminans]
MAHSIQTDSRNRLSKLWTPTGGLAPQDGEQDDSHALLIRSGFLRQAHSGVFHLLPLGLRVQSKLEALIDTYMHSIGASKASLSSITTEALWRQSGRYSANSELLRITDRRESGFLLSPTHEEEITALVASMVHSYKDLPLRLYQVGRKYRDERRPRQGLLRAKEFMMKDLYTFDSSSSAALETYESVRAAYTAIFNDLKLPYLVADADSGNMGGKLSHEYHFPSPKGEDNVWSCSSCSYVANEELAEKAPMPHDPAALGTPYIFQGISTDHQTRIVIIIPRPSIPLPSTTEEPWTRISDYINLHALKRALAEQNVDLDTSIDATTLAYLLSQSPIRYTAPIQIADRSIDPSSTHDITATTPGSRCPKCATGKLDVTKAIEVAHTFHLGTRYSAPLNALVALQDGKTREHMHMGCHGIGVSRIIGAVASLLSDTRGLNWPRAIAPFEVVVLSAPKGEEVGDAEEVYDALGGDVVLDDRVDKGLGWKLRDADLIGYPVVVVLGRGWRERREVEVQCRRLDVKRDVGLGEVREVVEGLLGEL